MQTTLLSSQPNFDYILKIRIDEIRAYVWMHSQCNRWAIFYSIIFTIIQCIASYGAGTISAIQDSNLNYVTMGLSFSVGIISTIAKLKFCNFDAISEQHNISIVNWNNLWSKIEIQFNLSVGEQEQTDVEFLKMVETTFSTFESNSESILPLWVRKKCANAWLEDTNFHLPDMCKDSTRN
jgi:hypothetical protein